MNWLWLNPSVRKQRWLVNMTNVNFIFQKSDEKTKIVFNDGSEIEVEETPDQIANMICFETFGPMK